MTASSVTVAWRGIGLQPPAIPTDCGLIGAAQFLQITPVELLKNPTAPQIKIASGQVDIGQGVLGLYSGRYDVWLIRFDPRIENVPIARGENSGITLPHKNVVKQLVKLGTWNGKPAAYRIPAGGDAAWRQAVLVQAGPGGVILAAAHN